MAESNPAEPIIETIDIIEEIVTMDSKMALAMLALGAVVGAVAYILWMESKKGSGMTIPRIAPVEYIDNDDDDSNEAEQED